jgi:hypothetical protein
MTLFETAETIKGWVKSCNKAEQLELCNDAIEEFIIERFVGQADSLEITQVVHGLRQSIVEQGLIIVENKYTKWVAADHNKLTQENGPLLVTGTINSGAV